MESVEETGLAGCWVETGRADGGGPTAGAIDHRMDAGVSGCVRSPGPYSWCPAAVRLGPVVMALGRARAGRTDAVFGLDGPGLGRVRADGEDGVQGVEVALQAAGRDDEQAAGGAADAAECVRPVAGQEHERRRADGT